MPSLQPEEWTTLSNDAEGERLDLFIVRNFPELSRARAQKLIDEKFVQVESLPAKANRKLKIGERISIFLPKPKSMDLTPEDIPLTIYYEDEHLVVLEKPAGLVVHPGAGNWSGTLVHALLHRFGTNLGTSKGIGGELRPGIVHRIDKNTSGVLVVTRSDAAHQGLAEQFKVHSITRAYTALAWGKLPSSGEWNEPIDRDPRDRQRMAVQPEGRNARTAFTVLENFGELASLFRAELFTGRTHQIRVHASHHGFPLVGDTTYVGAHRSGRQKKEKGLAYLRKNAPDLALRLEALGAENRQFLHASTLSFTHPITQKALSFSSPLPEDLQSLIMELEKCR